MRSVWILMIERWIGNQFMSDATRTFCSVKCEFIQRRAKLWTPQSSLPGEFGFKCVPLLQAPLLHMRMPFVITHALRTHQFPYQRRVHSYPHLHHLCRDVRWTPDGCTH
uniref:Uncharacterized protein n=1 Tax=Parascaris equorum TaxID=6256 RepID=A0A914REN1_PAREQ